MSHLIKFFYFCMLITCFYAANDSIPFPVKNPTTAPMFREHKLLLEKWAQSPEGKQFFADHVAYFPKGVPESLPFFNSSQINEKYRAWKAAKQTAKVGGASLPSALVESVARATGRTAEDLYLADASAIAQQLDEMASRSAARDAALEEAELEKKAHAITQRAAERAQRDRDTAAEEARVLQLRVEKIASRGIAAGDLDGIHSIQVLSDVAAKIAAQSPSLGALIHALSSSIDEIKAQGKTAQEIAVDLASIQRARNEIIDAMKIKSGQAGEEEQEAAIKASTEATKKAAETAKELKSAKEAAEKVEQLKQKFQTADSAKEAKEAAEKVEQLKQKFQTADKEAIKLRKKREEIRKKVTAEKAKLSFNIETEIAAASETLSTTYPIVKKHKPDLPDLSIIKEKAGTAKSIREFEGFLINTLEDPLDSKLTHLEESDPLQTALTALDIFLGTISQLSGTKVYGTQQPVRIYDSYKVGPALLEIGKIRAEVSAEIQKLNGAIVKQCQTSAALERARVEALDSDLLSVEPLPVVLYRNPHALFFANFLNISELDEYLPYLNLDQLRTTFCYLFEVFKDFTEFKRVYGDQFSTTLITITPNDVERLLAITKTKLLKAQEKGAEYSAAPYTQSPRETTLSRELLIKIGEMVSGRTYHKEIFGKFKAIYDPLSKAVKGLEKDKLEGFSEAQVSGETDDEFRARKILIQKIITFKDGLGTKGIAEWQDKPVAELRKLIPQFKELNDGINRGSERVLTQYAAYLKKSSAPEDSIGSGSTAVSRHASSRSVDSLAPSSTPVAQLPSPALPGKKLSPTSSAFAAGLSSALHGQGITSRLEAFKATLPPDDIVAWEGAVTTKKIQWMQTRTKPVELTAVAVEARGAAAVDVPIVATPLSSGTPSPVVPVSPKVATPPPPRTAPPQPPRSAPPPPPMGAPPPPMAASKTAGAVAQSAVVVEQQANIRILEEKLDARRAANSISQDDYDDLKGQIKTIKSNIGKEGAVGMMVPVRIKNLQQAIG